jgi:hypothetical protein
LKGAEKLQPISLQTNIEIFETQAIHETKLILKLQRSCCCCNPFLPPVAAINNKTPDAKTKKHNRHNDAATPNASFSV